MPNTPATETADPISSQIAMEVTTETLKVLADAFRRETVMRTRAGQEWIRPDLMTCGASIGAINAAIKTEWSVTPDGDGAKARLRRLMHGIVDSLVDSLNGPAGEALRRMDDLQHDRKARML